MALKIRLSRIGSTHQPHYRIVVAEARSRRDGAPAETLGYYDPRAKGHRIKIALDRVDYWIARGAQPSDTLRALINRERRTAGTAAPSAAAEPAQAAAPAATAQPNP